jgi:anaerobic ribonucleoside-triphosphate reductase
MFLESSTNLEEVKSYLNKEYTEDWFNSEFYEKVYDYIDEEEASEYDGDYEETYINLCTGGAIEHDLIDEMTRDLEEKFPNIERDILLDLANDHLVDSCQWYDSLTISKSGET